MVNGWILGSNSELLFWVPPLLRPGLWRPSTAVVIGAHETRLDLRRFVHGDDWIRCKEPGPDIPDLSDSDLPSPALQPRSRRLPQAAKKASKGSSKRLSDWLAKLKGRKNE